MVTPRQSLKMAIDAVDRATSREELLLATHTLAELADLHAVPKLIEVLGFNNPLLAHVAIRGIIKIGADAVPLVLENLDPEIEAGIEFMVYEGPKNGRPSKIINVDNEEIIER